MKPIDFFTLLTTGLTPKNAWVEIRLMHKTRQATTREWIQWPAVENHSVEQTFGKKTVASNNIYYGIAFRESNKSGIKNACLETHLLWVDLDLRGSVYVNDDPRSMTPAELNTALKYLNADLEDRLADLGLAPRAIVNSGHGLHVLFALPEVKPRGFTESTNRWLAQQLKDLGADSTVWNLDRVFRLPGSFNVKNEIRPLLVDVILAEPSAFVDETKLGQAEAVSSNTEAQLYGPQTPLEESDRELILNKWRELGTGLTDGPGRHYLALSLAGWLKSNGWDEQATVGLVAELAREAADEETRNRVQAVRDTFKRNEVTRGFSGLQTDFGLALKGFELPVAVAAPIKHTPRPDTSDTNRPNAGAVNVFKTFPPLPRTISAKSDRANAMILAHNLAQTMKYTNGLGWFEYSGTHWQRMNNVQAREVAQTVLIGAINELTDYCDAKAKLTGEPRDAEAAEEARKWRASISNQPKIDTALSTACGFPDFQLDVSLWDCEAHMINTPKGVLDLTTGELHEHEPGWYMTRITDCWLDEAAQSDDLDALMVLLEKEGGGRKESVLRLLGSSLHGEGMRDEILPIFYGVGGSGKGTLMDLMAAMLGDYAESINAKLLTTEASASGGQPELLRLRAARFLYASETGASKSFDASLVKQITGGDPINCRELYSNTMVSFVVRGKLFVATNFAPKTDAYDSGMRRRLWLVPFTATPDVIDPEYKKRLARDQRARNAFFTVLVDECRAWLREGLLESQAVSEATSEYWSEQDHAARFVRDCLEVCDPLHVIRGHDLTEAAAAWFRDEVGGFPNNTFRSGLAKTLLKLGVKKGAANGSVIWRGVKFMSKNDEGL